MNNIEKITISATTSIKNAMKVIDSCGMGFGLIIDKHNKLIGVVSDGDVRRSILKGINIDNVEIGTIASFPITINEEWNEIDVRYLINKSYALKDILKYSNVKIPIVDDDFRPIDILCVTNKGCKSIKNEVGNRTIIKDADTIKKVLIIGGAGYLGSILIRKLLKKNYCVRVLDNLTYGNDGIRDIDNPNFQFIEGDMRNIQTLMIAFEGVDAVIHLGAIVSDPACALNPKNTIEINYISTMLIAEIAKFYQINKFIFASTASVYGANSNKNLNEESILNPVSLYAETKLKSELALFRVMDDLFKPTIFRMATLFGYSPRQRFDLVVNVMSAKGIIENEITIFGGRQWRPLLHVSDAADAYIKCLQLPSNHVGGKIYNLGDNTLNYTVNDIGKLIQKTLQNTIIDIRSESVDVRNYKLDFSKIEREFNFKAKYSIEDGVEEIRRAIEEKRIIDYRDEKYYNHLALNIHD